MTSPTRAPQFFAARDGKRVRGFAGVDYTSGRRPTRKVQPPAPLTKTQRLYDALFDEAATPIPARSAALPTGLAKRDQPSQIQHAAMAKIDAAVQAAVQKAVAPLVAENADLSRRVAFLEADQPRAKILPFRR